MKLKKLIAITATIAMSISIFVGCGSSETTTEDTANNSTTEETNEISLPEDVQEIVDRGVLRVGVKMQYRDLDIKTLLQRNIQEWKFQ